MPLPYTCDECFCKEGKFIEVVDVFKDREGEDLEDTVYYCTDCFKVLMQK
jgi:hypothetical protein